MDIKNLKVTKQIKAFGYIGAFALGILGANWISLKSGEKLAVTDGIKITSISDIDFEIDNDEEEEIEILDEKEVVDPMDLIDLSNYKGTSINEALASVGLDYSFEARKALAEHYGIENYQGTAAQNKELLEKLQVPIKDRENGKTTEKKEDKKKGEQKPSTNETQNNVVENKETTNKKEEEKDKNEADKKPSGSGSGSGSNENKPAHTNHQFGSPITYYTTNSNGTHIAFTQKKCSCGEEESSQIQENCSYTKLISTDTANETWQCVCGHTKQQGHNWGTKTENGQDITYCTNPDCGYSISAPHTCSPKYDGPHILSEDERTEDHCTVTYVSCDCGKMWVEYDGHKFEVLVPGDEYDDAVVGCTVCGHRTTRAITADPRSVGDPTIFAPSVASVDEDGPSMSK